MGRLAVLAALAFGVLLGVRLLNSPDLGYHLAYGDEFWATGRIVDHNDYIYTQEGNRQKALGTRQQKEPETAKKAGSSPSAYSLVPNASSSPGPGCWYDSQGRYRFPNANWLSQVVMSLVHRFGGVIGLCILQAVMVAGILLILLALMRRLGLGPPGIATALLLVALTAYERFNLRPELFGYLFLVAELYVLCVWRPGLKQLLVLTVLQLLMVNLHSYFMLGWVLIGAFVVESALRKWWHRAGVSQHPNTTGATKTDAKPQAENNGDAKWLSTTLGAAITVSLVNPWTWRLAILPLQTLLFLRDNQIAGASGGMHPWSHIGEFYGPFASGFAHTPAGWAYIVLLCVGAAGVLAAIASRRFAWSAIMLAMLAVSVSMRRNIAPAAMLVAPLAFASLRTLAGAVGRTLPSLAKRLAPLKRLAIPLAALLLLAGIGLCATVVTQKFYTFSRSPLRFGMGVSELELPLGACRWLNEHNIRGRIWTDYTSSSNVYYFTQPHREVPILTNTWAFPPAVMEAVLRVNTGERDFQPPCDEFDVQAVLLRVDDSCSPLAYKLAHSGQWSVVYLDALHVVLVRSQAVKAGAGPAITPDTLDLPDAMARSKQADPSGNVALRLLGRTLWGIGWDDQAIEATRQAVTEQPDDPYASYQCGQFLAQRGTMRMGDKQTYPGRKDLEEARRAFDRTIELQPDNADAKRERDSVDVTLDNWLQHGVLPSTGPVAPGAGS